jgi:hypothetical protein
MDPPLQYKLSSACQHAQTPQWLLETLRREHGSLHDPCPHSPSADGLHAPWSSTDVNYANPPFAHAGIWLHKAAEEATKHKQSIVLVPFRPHTRYMSYALQHAVSVCMLSKPVRFEDADGNTFKRPLPTPVCLVSFGADLAPRACTPVAHTAVVHLNTSSASVENVALHVEQCTGAECGTTSSPIAGSARHAAAKQEQSAVLCPARVTNAEVQQLIHAAHTVVFVSPPLVAQNTRRCVEGSLIAFFTSAAADAYLSQAQCVHFRCSLLHTG